MESRLGRAKGGKEAHQEGITAIWGRAWYLVYRMQGMPKDVSLMDWIHTTVKKDLTRELREARLSWCHEFGVNCKKISSVCHKRCHVVQLQGDGHHVAQKKSVPCPCREHWKPWRTEGKGMEGEESKRNGRGTVSLQYCHWLPKISFKMPWAPRVSCLNSDALCWLNIKMKCTRSFQFPTFS